MKQTNLDSIEANSSHDLKLKIGRDRIKQLKPQDCSRMYSVSVPSQRCTYYCSTLTRANKRVKELEKDYPGIITFIYKPIK